MKTYCLLKQISSKNEIEKHFAFPDWLATSVGFLNLYMSTKNDKYIGKKEGKNERVSWPYKAADVKVERHSHRN